MKKVLSNGDVATIIEYGRLMGATPKKHKAALKKIRLSQKRYEEMFERVARFVAEHGMRGIRELGKVGLAV